MSSSYFSFILTLQNKKSEKLSGSDAWVHFYEDDCRFERLWRRPNNYAGFRDGEVGAKRDVIILEQR
jgi:hypothetical protein